jgi:hypothetical protein
MLLAAKAGKLTAIARQGNGTARRRILMASTGVLNQAVLVSDAPNRSSLIVSRRFIVSVNSVISNF